MQLKRIKMGLVVLLAGTTVYTLAGFLLAPYAIKHWIEHSIATEPGFELRVGHVYVNPFSLFLSLADLTLVDRENAPVVSICRAETRLWTVDRLRTGQRGRNVEIHSLRVADPATGAEILTVPRLSASGLVVTAADGSMVIAVAQLFEPALSVTRNASGRLLLPAWLPRPMDDSQALHVLIDKIEVSAGVFQFTDRARSPTLRFDTNGIAGNITRLRVADGVSTFVELDGQVGNSGGASVTARWLPSDRPAQTEIDLNLRQLDLPVLSPYFARIAGRSIAAGTGDLTLHYRRRGPSVRIDNRIKVAGLELGGHAVTGGDETLPLELVLALLTDPAGRIYVSIPIVSDEAAGGSDATDSLAEYVRDLAARPFDVLSDLIESDLVADRTGQADEEFGTLPFAPGSAEIEPATGDKLTLLARALEQRPLLGLRVYPAFDPIADRNALAAEQVGLHVRLATSAGGPRGPAVGAPPDFDDPRVRAVLDEFAGERLGEAERPSGPGEGSAAYYRAVYDALVTNEDVSELALNRLARFRARSIVDAFASHGIGEQRVRFADDIEMRTGESGAVALRLEALHHDI